MGIYIARTRTTMPLECGEAARRSSYSGLHTLPCRTTRYRTSQGLTIAASLILPRKCVVLRINACCTIVRDVSESCMIRHE